MVGLTDPIALAARFVRALSVQPTRDQRAAFEAIARLIVTPEPGAALVLLGAAGTGKTTILRAVVDVLFEEEAHLVLMAPTGRAAKVLASRTGYDASTLHKVLYDTETSLSGAVRYRLRRNSDPQDTLYLVDEASMIGEQTDSGSSLLHDLIGYCLADEPHRKLLLIGDPYQLPPVGAADSPALAMSYLRRSYGLLAGRVQLTEVRRQAEGSTILANATRLRDAVDTLRTEGELDMPSLTEGPEVQVLSSTDHVIESFLHHYDPDDPDAVVALTYSNGIAAQLNQAIRARLFDSPGVLEPGDRVMVVKNHYQKAFHHLPFIANGDIGYVARVFNETATHKYDQNWVEALVTFADARGKTSDLSATIPTDLLAAKAPNLTREQTKRIWEERIAELTESTDAKPARSDLKADPFLASLQLKYAYAITGHKAQGGQWRHVIVVFEPYLIEKQLSEDPLGFLRWSYTALTRASESLALFNCPFPFGTKSPFQ